MRKESFPVQKIPHTKLLLIAVVIAAFATFVVDPGVLYSDSYTRIAWVNQIATGTLTPGFDPYLTMLMSVYMASIYWLTYSYAACIFAQATFFLWTVLEALFHVCRSGIYTVLAFLFLSPILVGYAVYWESGPLSAAFILWMIYLDNTIEWPSLKVRLVCRTILFAIACFSITGFRLNAATAIIGLLLWDTFTVLKERSDVVSLAIKWIAALCSIVIALQVPAFFGTQKAGNISTGLLWETGCMLVRIGPGNGYDNYLDNILGEGATQKIFGVNDPESSLYTLWEFDTYWAATRNHESEIINKYVHLALENPADFICVKLKMAQNTLTRADFAEYYTDLQQSMVGTGASNTVRRDRAIELVIQYAPVFSFLRIPILLFSVALALILVCKLLHQKVPPMMQLWFVALCYEGGYFITTQAYEFRYFFPAWLLLVLVILAAAGNIVRGLWANGHPQAEVLEYGIEKGETAL